MEKRGASHVEMILSFVIFVAAIGFALFFFSPFNSSRLVETNLNYGSREIAQNVSVDVDIYSVIINGSDVGDVLAIKIEGLNLKPDAEARVENESGGEIPSRKGIAETDVVYVENPGWGMVDFATIKISEEYDESENSIFTLPPVDESLYELVSLETKKIASEDRVQNLANAYLFDYLALKKEFNLPSRVNFAFSLDFTANDSIEAFRDVPEGLEVFSETERKEVLRSDGKTEFADLRVLVW